MRMKSSTYCRTRIWEYTLDAAAAARTYMVIPGVVVSVEDDGSTQAASWVDTSSCDGNSRQMHQVNCKSNGKGRKHLQCSNRRIHDS